MTWNRLARVFIKPAGADGVLVKADRAPKPVQFRDVFEEFALGCLGIFLVNIILGFIDGKAPIKLMSLVTVYVAVVTFGTPVFFLFRRWRDARLARIVKLGEST